MLVLFLLFCASYGCCWRQHQEGYWSQPYHGSCVLNTFFMLDLMVYGRNGAQTLLLRSSFETGLQCDSNFVNVIRIQKVAQMYFLNCHWYLLVMYFFVVTVLHSYLLSSFCS